MMVELIEVINEQGRPTGEIIARDEAHRTGALHRGANVIIINDLGEILLEKRADHRDIFPGCYELPGGHVSRGSGYKETALSEVAEEVGLILDEDRLSLIGQEGEFEENLILDEKGIHNRERKSIYLYRITPDEQRLIVERNRSLSRLSEGDLQMLGPGGESSALLFVSFSHLMEDFHTHRERYASAIEVALHNVRIVDQIRHVVDPLIDGARNRFVSTYARELGTGVKGKGLDDVVYDHLLPKPDKPAEDHVIDRIFQYGRRTLAGAYTIGSFRADPLWCVSWGDKLSDVFDTYVQNELAAMLRRIHKGKAQEHAAPPQDPCEDLLERAKRFVRESLHLITSHGEILRDGLSNLQEIAAAREALRWFLRTNTDIDEEFIDNPLGDLNALANGIVSDILRSEDASPEHPTYEDIRRRVLQSIAASAIDYNNPDATALRGSEQEAAAFIRRHLQTSRSLAHAFGGEFFLREFHRRYLQESRSVRMVFLPDNNGQAMISLKLAEEFLRANPRLVVCFIPKNGQYSNDASWQDIEQILPSSVAAAPGPGLLAYLLECRKSERFRVLREGPQLQGLDPSRMSAQMAEEMASADVIYAEDQAYAEIRGWRIPTYVAFQVKGRVAQAAHGVSRDSKASVFLGIQPMVDHFWGLHPHYLKRTTDRTAGHSFQFDVARQTSKEYVECVRSDNYTLITKHIYGGDDTRAIEAINKEAARLDNTFAEVIRGYFPYQFAPTREIQATIASLYAGEPESHARATVRAELGVIWGQYMGLSYLELHPLWKLSMLSMLRPDSVRACRDRLELDLAEERILAHLLDREESALCGSQEEHRLAELIRAATLLETAFRGTPARSYQAAIRSFVTALRADLDNQRISRGIYTLIRSLFSPGTQSHIRRILHACGTAHGADCIAGLSDEDITAMVQDLPSDYDFVGPSYPFPDPDELRAHYRGAAPEVMACGGGGGFNQVTLDALRSLGVPTIAGVPSTDNGGSTGKLQEFLLPGKGFTFGVGDAACVLQDSLSHRGKHPLLSYRASSDEQSLLDTVLHKIEQELANPTYSDYNLKHADDFLTFVSAQLHMARIIDRDFRQCPLYPTFRIKGSSIRNLNFVAVYHATGAFRDGGGTDEDKARVASYVLEKALGTHVANKADVRVLPVTYEEGTLYATYEKAIDEAEIQRLGIPGSALENGNRTVIGQKYIDQIFHESKIVDFGIRRSTENGEDSPSAGSDYLYYLRKVRMFVLGAGSLYGSQLAQLAARGVVDTLLERKDIRRVLVLNHVNLDETNGYALKDHIIAIEQLASKMTVRHGVRKAPLRIGDLFTDIVVPKTLVRDIDEAIRRGTERGRTNAYGDPPGTPCPPGFPCLDEDGSPFYVDSKGNRIVASEGGILRNRYVYYVLNHPEFRRQSKVTSLDLRILGYLEQPSVLYKSRSEKGRYRGAVYARDEDIAYIVEGGIPRRNIIEVELVSEKEKILKAEGVTKIERFPGLTSEVLEGVFRILLQKGVYHDDDETGSHAPIV